MTLLVRAAAGIDARALGPIYYESELAWLRECHPDGWPPSWFQLRSPEDAGIQLERLLATSPSGFRCFLAEHAGEACGFSLAGPSQTDEGQLHALYVHPDRWGSGVGSTLLEHAVAWLTRLGYDRAFLWAVASNPRARAFYEARHWTADGAAMRTDGGMPLVRYVRSLPERPGARAER